jgi:hypothetical protein
MYKYVPMCTIYIFKNTTNVHKPQTTFDLVSNCKPSGQMGKKDCNLSQNRYLFSQNLLDFLKIIISIPAVYVMIAIFCDFCNFSANKWRFSQIPMF